MLVCNDRRKLTTHFFNLLNARISFSAPKLVQSSPSLTSNPILASLLRTADVLSLLVLEQKRIGMPEARRCCKAGTAPSIALDPMCKVPERSMRRARMAGRATEDMMAEGEQLV